jgi:group I intron endonuclease
MRKKKLCGIYQIRNLLNGNVYIGQSKSVLDRKSSHFCDLRKNIHDNEHLQNSYNLYGEENFIFEILLCCEESELTYYEDLLIKAAKPNCYNIREAADSNVGIKYKPHTQETKDKIGAAHRGIPFTEEHKIKLSLAHKGQNNRKDIPLTEEHKENISKANKGKPFTEEHRANISKSKKGKKSSFEGARKGVETRRRLREERKNNLEQ